MQTITANIAFVTARRCHDILLKRCCFTSLLHLSRGKEEERIGYSSRMMGIRFIVGFSEKAYV